jgi:hypothetical protein
MLSILGNGYEWFDCTSDNQHEIKLSRNIVVVQYQGPNSRHRQFVPLNRICERYFTNNFALGSENYLLGIRDPAPEELLAETRAQCYKTFYGCNLRMFIIW